MNVKMSPEEMATLPVSVDLATAGRAFGLGRTKSFELARREEFPCKVLLVGGTKYRVPRSAIYAALDFDPASVNPEDIRAWVAGQRHDDLPAA